MVVVNPVILGVGSGVSLIDWHLPFMMLTMIIAQMLPLIIINR